MAELEQSKALPGQKKKLRYSTDGLTHLLNDVDIILTVYILKYYSSKDNPFSYSQIAEAIYEYRNLADGRDDDDYENAIEALTKKLRRKLGAYLLLTDIREEVRAHYSQDEYDDLVCGGYDYDDNAQSGKDVFYSSLSDILCLMFGGMIRLANKDSGAKSGIKKLYFQPVILPGHTDMIKSSLISNQYFSQQETEYLINAVEALGPKKKPVQSEDDYGGAVSVLGCLYDHFSFTPKDNDENTESFKNKYPSLHIINSIYDAVTSDRQIELVYGSYQKNDKDRNIELKETHPEKPPFKLNPYAIFFTDGHHYLIATKSSDTAEDDEADRVWHFRVDRIMSVEILEENREKKPDSLAEYWKDKKTGFDQKWYSQMHPTMVYSKKTSMRTALLQTKQGIALSIVADAFGKENVSVKKVINKTNEGESSSPQTVYELEVYGEKENILRFCLQQHALVTLIRPNTMVDEIVKELRSSLSDYGVI